LIVMTPISLSPSPSFPDEETLAKYFAGELDPETTVRFQAYLAEHPARAEALRAVRGWVRRGQTLAVVPDVRQSIAAVLAQLDQPVSTKQPVSATPPVARSSFTGWRFPVVGLLGIAGAIIAIWMPIHDEKESRSPARLYQTADGEQATVTLNDGTRATLAPASTMRVSYDGDRRGAVVALAGQVLFTVQHRASAPFQVQTENAIVRVLGTTFTVRQYPSDSIAQVTVVDGRVSVGSAVLTERMRVLVARDGNMRVHRNISIEDDTAWATGRLVFRDTPVRDVIAELGRVYRVELRCPDSNLVRLPLTWSIRAPAVSLARALDELSEMIDARYTRAGRVITLSPGRTPARTNASPSSGLMPEVKYGR
jgi:ferric-dicitrate binding protein FerR (iron transport regulator)